MTTEGFIHCNSADTALADGRLRQAQLKMLAMLEIVDSICLKHGIDYWLDAGTLLGAVRHQGFIPWDDDMDISMPRASYEAFLQIAAKEIPDNMWLQTAQSDPGYYNLAAPLKIRDLNSRFIEKHESSDEPYVQGIFIDVFVYDRMPESLQQRRRYKFLAKKLSRLLRTKYSNTAVGHHAAIYKSIGQLIPKSLLEYGLQSIISKANTSESRYLGRGFNCVGNNCIALEDIYPLKRATFETGQFNIINRAEEILTQQYGDYLSLPPLDQRKMRHCKELVPFI